MQKAIPLYRIQEMIERISSIQQIERSFNVSEEVLVSMKPRGFNRWCQLPYHKHPNGCPNFGIKDSCPPNTPYFLDVYEEKIFIAYLKFDFKSYLKWRQDVHPDWGNREIRNPRHFQNHLDAILRGEIKNLDPGYVKDRVTVFSPEAMSVNMHLTCRNTGIELEWPPSEIMYRIAFLAQPKDLSVRR